MESQLPVTGAQVARKDDFHPGIALVQTIDFFIDLAELAEPLRRKRRRGELLLASSLGDSLATDESHRFDLWHLYMVRELEGLRGVPTTQIRRRGGLLRSHKTVPLNVPETQEQVFELGKVDWRWWDTLMCLRDEQKSLFN
jgi:hypothetical protein